MLASISFSSSTFSAIFSSVDPFIAKVVGISARTFFAFGTAFVAAGYCVYNLYYAYQWTYNELELDDEWKSLLDADILLHELENSTDEDQTQKAEQLYQFFLNDQNGNIEYRENLILRLAMYYVNTNKESYNKLVDLLVPNETVANRLIKIQEKIDNLSSYNPTDNFSPRFTGIVQAYIEKDHVKFKELMDTFSQGEARRHLLKAIFSVISIALPIIFGVGV